MGESTYRNVLREVVELVSPTHRIVLNRFTIAVFRPDGDLVIQYAEKWFLPGRTDLVVSRKSVRMGIRPAASPTIARGNSYLY